MSLMFVLLSVGALLGSVCLLSWATRRLQKRVSQLESAFSGIGPETYRRLEEGSTKVVVGDRWFDELET